MEKVTFASNKVGLQYLEPGLIVKFRGGVASLTFEEAKKAAVSPLCGKGKVFEMTKRGEQLFNAYKKAEKDGTPLEEVSLSVVKKQSAAEKAAATKAAKKAAEEAKKLKAAEKKLKAATGKAPSDAEKSEQSESKGT